MEISQIIRMMYLHIKNWQIEIYYFKTAGLLLYLIKI